MFMKLACTKMINLYLGSVVIARTLLFFILLIYSSRSFAQVSAYTFTQDATTYSPVTESSILNVVADDNTGAFNTASIPFTFNYNGVNYSAVTASSNGFLVMGSVDLTGKNGSGTAYTTTSNNTGLVISSATAFNNVIAPLNADLNVFSYSITGTTTSGSNVISNCSGANFTPSRIRVGMRLSNIVTAGVCIPTITAVNFTAGTITMSCTPEFPGTGSITIGSNFHVQTTGVSPNRVFTAQWTNYKRYSTSDTLDFQVKLYETTNAIEFIYGKAGSLTSSALVKVGLRGNSASDYNIRTTSSNWSATTSGAVNTAGCTLNTTVKPASGLVFRFTPLSCPGASGGTATGSTSFCGSGVPTITATGYSTGSGSGYQWESSNDNFINNIQNVSGQTNPASLSTGTVSSTTYYRLKVTCTSGFPTAYSNIVTVTVKPIPTASASSNSPVCSGNSLNLTGTTNIGTSFTWSGPNGYSSTNQNPEITNIGTNQSGTYTFTAILDGCSTTANTSVVVNPTPSTPVTTNYSVCSGASIPNGEGLTSTFNGISRIAASQTIYFNVTDQPANSVGSIVGTATLPALPAGATLTSLVLSYPNVVAQDPSWRSEIFLYLSGAVQTTFAYATPGALQSSGFLDYAVTITSDATIDPAGGVVNLFYQEGYDDPEIDPDAFFPTGTQAASLVINYTIPDLSNVVWYDAANGGNIIGTGTPFNPVGIDPAVPNTNTPGVYTYYAQVNNGPCVSARTAATFSIGAPLSTTISTSTGNTFVCAGGSLTLSAQPSGGGLPYATYSWKVNNVEVGNSATFAVLSSTIGSTTYDLTMTDACNNTATASITIEVRPVPTATASSNSPLCSGSAINLFGSSDIGNSYTWTGPNGYSSTDQNPVIPNASLSSGGTYSFVASLNGCSSSANTTTVDINPVPSSANISPGSPVICSGGNVVLTASGGNYVNSGVFAASSSATLNLAIPDNNTAGASNTLLVNGIPAGAIIDSVVITLNIQHSYAADVEVNLQAPNNQVINLLADIGGSTALGFVNTRISSDNTKPLPGSGTSPFSATFRAQGATTGLFGTLPAVTTSAFNNLFSTANGNWTILAYDDANQDVGTLVNWSIKIAYTNTVQGNFSWSPAGTLSSGTGATVTASPTETTTYTVTSTIGNCVSENSLVTVSIGTSDITASAGVGGSISPSGLLNVNCGTSPQYTITADPCFTIADVIVNGISLGAVSSYTFNNITQGAHTISASFTPITYTITSSAGTGGSISPSGSVTVACNGNQTFGITPDPGYIIADVIVDGVSQGAVSTYTFNNVQQGHSISASFALNNLTITASAGSGGSISPAGNVSVNAGDDQSYTITADACYNISDVIVDGVSVGAVSSYTFNDVSANHTISVAFVQNGPFTINVSAGANGSISPSSGTVNCGDNITYTITAASCFAIEDVIVDGVSQGAVSTYTFNNVQQPHSISASFVALSPLVAPTVTGPTNVCPFLGNNVQVSYTAASAGASSYTWTLPPNVNLVSGQGTANITVTFNAGFATQANKQIRVRASNACFTSAQTLYYLLVQYPGTPAAITTSSTNVCPSLGTNVPITFSIPKVSAASSYIWTSQPGTTTIVHPNGSGVNDTTITVTFSSGFTTSAITVQAVNDCGTSGIRSITLTRANPSTPSLISGPTNACAHIAPNGSIATYTVPQQPNAESYNWLLPAGALNISGQGTNSISFTYPAGYTGGNISVSATNGCGTSLNRNLAIATLSPSTPSVIDVINLASCEDPSPDRLYSYSLASLPANASSVQWTVPSSGTIVSGQGTSSITVSYPASAVAGQVSATAVNNCGSSVSRTIEVKLPACPPEFAKNSLGKPSPGFMSEDAGILSIQAFPNPAASQAQLKVDSRNQQEMITVRILDLRGKEHQRMILMPGAVKSFGASLAAGMYLIEAFQGSQKTVQKFIRL